MRFFKNFGSMRHYTRKACQSNRKEVEFDGAVMLFLIHLLSVTTLLQHFSSKFSFLFWPCRRSLGRIDYHVLPPIHMELPAAYLHALPKKHYRHIPQPSSYLQTMPNVFVVVHPCMVNCGSGNHVCLCLIASQWLRKKSSVCTTLQVKNDETNDPCIFLSFWIQLVYVFNLQSLLQWWTIEWCNDDVFSLANP